VGDRVSLVSGAGGFGRIGNSGGSRTVLGLASRAGDIASVGGVVLHRRASVNGDLVTGDGLERDNDVVITGSILPNPTVILPRLSPFLATFPPLTQGRDGRAWRGGVSRAWLVSAGHLAARRTPSPGRGGVLHGLAGDDPPSSFAGAIVVYQGERPVELRTRFEGTFIAPRARLTGANVRGRFEGAFFARELVVRPRVELTCRPYEFAH
jgi:hypothetical protein